jgi:hypothetical protein
LNGGAFFSVEDIGEFGLNPPVAQVNAGKVGLLSNP